MFDLKEKNCKNIFCNGNFYVYFFLIKFFILYSCINVENSNSLRNVLILYEQNLANEEQKTGCRIYIFLYVFSYNSYQEKELPLFEYFIIGIVHYFKSQ